MVATDTATTSELRASYWTRLGQAIKILTRRKVTLVGLTMVMVWIVLALAAPVVTAYPPNTEHADAVNQGPTLQHWLGTDSKGRDVWSRIVFGSRTILTLAPLSVLCALVVGVTLGLLAGYHGGWVDELVMRVVDIIMAFPTILLYMIIIVSMGASAMNVAIAITVAGAPGIARLVRGLTLDIRTRDYVAASILQGERPWYIMFVQILPNASGPLLVDSMLRVGYAVFAIGTLGFLGLGLPPPSPDWGSMVNLARRFVWTNPWAVIFPSAAIASLVIGLNLLADGLQESMNQYR
jgi:peptide/nickel transport system permease protein